jgi:CDP-diacylglycerol--glycerol-3-phosphate 3-phosphatidyltransferase
MSSNWLDSRALNTAPLFLFTGAVLAAFGAYAIRSALRGRARSARAEQVGGSVLLSTFVMEFGLWLFGPVTRIGVRLRIHPDVFSWLSLLLQMLAGVLFALGNFGGGGWALVLGSFCDAVDGGVARARGLASDAGEVLDAALDRWGEMAVFFGLAWYYRGLWWAFLLVSAACAGAIMVSYARAKGQAFGVDAKMGLMQRHERAAWLSVATVFSGVWQAWSPSPGFARHGLVLFALAVIAVLANWTGWVRTRYTRQELRRR